MSPTIAWSRRAADELWSGVVTPLTFSILAEPMAQHMVERRLANAGFGEFSDQPVFRLIRGHVYVNASLILRVMSEVPSVFLSDGVLGILPEALRLDLRQRSRWLLDPRTVTTVLRLTWKERGWTPWSRARLFREEADRVASEFAGFEVPPGSTPSDMAMRIDATRARLGQFLDVVSWAMIYAYLSFHLFVHLTRNWLPVETSFSMLSAGETEIRTFQAHDELSSLARQLRGDSDLRRAVLDPPSLLVAEAIERGEIGSFGRALRETYVRHGHRLLARDLAFPTWRERPEIVIEMVRRLALAEPVHSKRDPLQALAEVQEKIGSGMRWQIFKMGLGWCQEYYAVRENMRYHADYFLAALRALARAGGQQLQSSGTLREVDDVFYLTITELDDALRRPSVAENLGATAAGRRREYEGYRSEAPPEVVWGSVDEAISELPVREPAAPPLPRLHATPAAPGIADGNVRVVRSIEELDSIQAGEIIVATATDPTWTSYLSLARGLVLEVGGLLSHGAIIARELGIPAVVDLAGATDSLRSGERVRMDGASGLIERLG